MIRKIQNIAILLVAIFFAGSLSAATISKGVITLSDGTKGVVEIVRGKPSAPTYVLLNGLVYDTKRWDPVTLNLASTGATVVRAAFAPQPENLKLLAAGEEPKYFSKGIELEEMAKHLADVLDSQKISAPVQLVGLSYGATVASRFARLYPNRVANLILVAPAVVSLEKYNPGGQSLRFWMDGVRFWENAPCEMYGSINPWLCVGHDFWYDSFYDSIIGSYIQGRVKAIPPGIDGAIYKKAIFHMVRAARDFDLKQETPRLRGVYMLMAEGDEAPLKADQQASWNLVKPTERHALIVFDGAVHALPDEAPGRTAETLVAIATTQAYAKAQEVHVLADH